MISEHEKQYQKDYYTKNKQYLKDCKAELRRMQKAQDIQSAMTLVDENGVIISGTVSEIESPFKTYRRVTAYKNKNCKRCDMLFKFGGVGDGFICSDCLDREKNGTEYYTTKERNSLV